MRTPLIRGKDFQNSIGQGEQTQGGVMGGWQKKGVVFCEFFFVEEKRRKMSV
jgi:hypothetical protein